MKILIKGAGDLASGIAYRLRKCGFSVVMTELDVPIAVRRTVSFSRAVYEGCVTIEGVSGCVVRDFSELEDVIERGHVAVVVDADASIKELYKPDVIVDAIVAKRNLGTLISDAAFVVCVGPGFEAGKDCHAVIESKRGHYLGRVITKGFALPNTGIPGNIGGFTIERIIKAVCNDVFHPVVEIGDEVTAGQVVAYCGELPVLAAMNGTVRGMLQDGVMVRLGMKVGDIDARCEKDHCFTISDKARSIGGGVLEAILCRWDIIKQFDNLSCDRDQVK